MLIFISFFMIFCILFSWEGRRASGKAQKKQKVPTNLLNYFFDVPSSAAPEGAAEQGTIATYPENEEMAVKTCGVIRTYQNV